MITFRFATHDDNMQLIELTAASGMAGDIGLRIDRKPDFFSLLNLRGKSKVMVALDEGDIIGSLCISVQQVYVGGEIIELYYIGDFKVAGPYRNHGIGLKLCNELANYIVPIGADLVFLNVSHGNTKPVSFFKDRPGIPDFVPIGVFHIYQFLGKKRKLQQNNYSIKLEPISDEIITYFNAHQRQYELGNVITKDKLEETDIYIIRDKSRIIAAMCLIDTMPFKQNVVTGMGVKMKVLITCVNLISPILGLSKMPKPNSPVRMLYIKYLVVENHNKALTKLLVNHARNIAYEKSYCFASIGLHEKDPFNNCFSAMVKVTFKSVGMLLSIKSNKSLIEKVTQGIPFEDYSLV